MMWVLEGLFCGWLLSAGGCFSCVFGVWFISMVHMLDCELTNPAYSLWGDFDCVLSSRTATQFFGTAPQFFIALFTDRISLPHFSRTCQMHRLLEKLYRYITLLLISSK